MSDEQRYSVRAKEAHWDDVPDGPRTTDPRLTMIRSYGGKMSNINAFGFQCIRH
jgi:hypothetical protein